MPFCTIKPAVSTAETGYIYPQVQKMCAGYNYNSANSVYALANAGGKIPDFEPNLDCFIVNGKSKLTDFLSNVILTTNGLLISNRFRDLLSDFELMQHRIYQAQIRYKNLFLNYNLIQFNFNLIEYVNFKKSSFIVLQNYSKIVDKIIIESLDDYNIKKNTLHLANSQKILSISAEKICLYPEFDTKLDLFKIGTFDTNFYISDKLRNEIITQNITGCDISTTKTIVFEVF